jgi:CubicO group peptidase (beta-lactamase class C family)
MTEGLTKEGLLGVRRALEAHVGDDKVPGLVGAVSRGEDTHIEVMGKKSKGGEPVTRDSIFRISSMTKPVATLAVMLLADEEKLSLDEPVDRLIPELANRKVLKRIDGPLDDTVPAGRPITVRDTMDFTLGIGLVFASPETHPILRAMEDLRLAQGFPRPSVPPPSDEWIRRLGSLPLMHQPGEQWMYSTGADIQGVLVARASGMPFEAFLSERIFEPLGMKDTAFSVPESKLGRFVDSYYTNFVTGKVELNDAARTGQWSRPPDFPSGAGGLVSTVDDYLAFAKMLMSLGTHKGRRILSSESVRAMTSDQLTPAQKAASGFVPAFFDTFSWGFGMSVVTGRDPLKSKGTYGWDGGLGTSWFNDPQKGLVVVLMTQQAQTSPAPPPVYVDFWKAAYSAVP